MKAPACRRRFGDNSEATIISVKLPAPDVEVTLGFGLRQVIRTYSELIDRNHGPVHRLDSSTSG